MRLYSQLAEDLHARELLANFRSQLSGEGGRIEQSVYYIDVAAGEAWLKISAADSYVSAVRRGIPAERIASTLARCIPAGRPIDVIALGAGDARTETTIVQALRRRAPVERMICLDINQELLACGQGWAHQHLPGVEVLGVLANFHHLDNFGASFVRPDRTRLILMLGGTFGNLDNEQVFVRDALGWCRPGDCLIIDPIENQHGDQDELVQRADSRLNGTIPEDWRADDEMWLGGAFRRYADVQPRFSYELSRIECPVPHSYAVRVMAYVGNQSFCAFLFKRYDLMGLSTAMASLGWKTVTGYPYTGSDGTPKGKMCIYQLQERS